MLPKSGGRYADSKDEDGCYFVDRDSSLFYIILNYMRDGTVHVDDLNILQSKQLLQEAQFYQIESLATVLRRSIRLKQSMIKRVSQIPVVTRDILMMTPFVCCVSLAYFARVRRR